jgi:hypothetical protein
MNTINAVEVNDVVQLSPATDNKGFGGCFMIVTEKKYWGVQGYVQALGDRDKVGGQAYYRAKWEEIEFVGKATWVVEN